MAEVVVVVVGGASIFSVFSRFALADCPDTALFSELSLFGAVAGGFGSESGWVEGAGGGSTGLNPLATRLEGIAGKSAVCGGRLVAVVWMVGCSGGGFGAGMAVMAWRGVRCEGIE